MCKLPYKFKYSCKEFYIFSSLYLNKNKIFWSYQTSKQMICLWSFYINIVLKTHGSLLFTFSLKFVKLYIDSKLYVCRHPILQKDTSWLP